MNVVVLTIFTLLVIGNVEAFKTMGPVGNLIIDSIYECPENERPTGDDVTWSAKISELNGKNAVSVNLTAKIPIDATTKYHYTLKKWENGSWKKYVELDGLICADVQRVLPKMWAKIFVLIKPDPGSKCPAQPGAYSIENFQHNSKDLDLKGIFYGKMLVQGVAFDKNKKRILCAMMEGDSQAPI